VSELKDLMPSPDLQTLIKQYGSYSAVSAKAWVIYDRQIAEAQAWLAERHKKVRPPGGNDGDRQQVTQSRKGDGQ
jgi:hypothetical protein